MKIKILLTSIAFCTLIFAISCEQNRCKTRGTTCQNEGACFDGLCNCTTEFEGDSCQFAVNKKFDNVFGGIRVVSGIAKPDSDDTLIVSRVQGSNTKVILRSVYNPLITFYGTVRNNEIKIKDSVANADGYTYVGGGSLNGELLTLSIRGDSLYLGVPQKSYEFTFAGTKTIK
jgi:hypothetical protein